MILLLGGTSETAGLATALTELAVPILVSTATDARLDVGEHHLISRRCGRLDEGGLAQLIADESVRVIIDAAHPFAAELHLTIDRVAQLSAVPLVRFQRQQSDLPSENIYYTDSHDEAAALACSFLRPILLTTGSRNLLPYVEAANRAGIALSARILSHPDSVAACDAAGLLESQRIYGRGPFSVADNCKLIKERQIGVLVTKESGERGGFPEKIAAAQASDCLAVVIRRPEISYQVATVCSDMTTLITKVKHIISVQAEKS